MADSGADAPGGSEALSPPPCPAIKPRTKYRFLEKAGSGSYGIVYKALQVETGRFVAIKRIRTKGDEGLPSNTLREIALLRELAHRNIVRLLDVEHAPSEVFLVFEWAYTDLDKFLRQHHTLSPAGGGGPPVEGLSIADIRSLTRQLLSGLAFLHARGVMHRDVKPANILLCDDARGTAGGSSADGATSPAPLSLRLADFGLARGYASVASASTGSVVGPHLPALGAGPEFTHEVATLWYRPPELLLGVRDYAEAVDVWSAGAVLGELASGAPLWPAESEVGMLMAVFRSLGTPTEATWPGVSGLPDWMPSFPRFPATPDRWARLAPRLPPDGQSLLAGLLECDPATRLSARDALRHPFLAEG